jgi:hypothetical protein
MSFPAALTVRQALALDAAASGALGLLLLVGAGLLEGWLGVPAAWLRAAAAVLGPWGLIVGWLASRPAPARGAVWAVIGLNIVWAIESVLILMTGWITATGLGVAFVLAQAAAVAVFAELQFLALRRGRPALA